MSRTDVCQGSLGETTESIWSPQIQQVTAGTLTSALSLLPPEALLSPPHASCPCEAVFLFLPR